MASDESAPKADRCADRPISAHSDGAPSSVERAPRCASPSDLSGGRADGIEAPFYERLAALIEAQALENERAPDSNKEACEADVVSTDAADRRDRSHGPKAQDMALDWTTANPAPKVANDARVEPQLGAFVAGAAIAVAAGGLMFTILACIGRPAENSPIGLFSSPFDQREAAELLNVEPPRIAAAVNGSTERPVQAEVPHTLRVGQDAMIGAPIEQTAGADNRPPADGSLPGKSSDDTTRFDTVVLPASPESEQAAPPAMPSPQELVGKTGSVSNRAEDAIATRTARAITAVNLRAAPDKGQAVLTIIPQGSPVEVLKCEYWCEVMFAGRRGWVDKGRIGATGAVADLDR